VLLYFYYDFDHAAHFQIHSHAFNLWCNLCISSPVCSDALSYSLDDALTVIYVILKGAVNTYLTGRDGWHFNSGDDDALYVLLTLEESGSLNSCQNIVLTLDLFRPHSEFILKMMLMVLYHPITLLVMGEPFAHLALCVIRFPRVLCSCLSFSGRTNQLAYFYIILMEVEIDANS
jgi:hypothetical protein